MTDTLDRFPKLDTKLAASVLREASIGRQQQAGTLDPSQVESIRKGDQDQSIGWDDAMYALENFDVVGQKAHESMGQQT